MDSHPPKLPMEQYGNTSTFNVESVLSKNATGSEYWRRTASRLASVDSVVDQIYFDVDHLEPWMAGRASRGASAAFWPLRAARGVGESREWQTAGGKMAASGRRGGPGVLMAGGASGLGEGGRALYCDAEGAGVAQQ